MVVNHKIIILILLHPQYGVASEMFIVRQGPPTEYATVVAPGSDAVDIRENVMLAKNRNNALDEACSVWPSARMWSRSIIQPPPTTFFSHNSDNV